MTGIVVCTYNRPQYFKKCFASLMRNKGIEDCKIIVIDDFSKEIYTPNHPNVTVIRNRATQGIAKNLIEGFRRLIAMGCTTLMNFDDDALLSPDTVNWLVSTLKQNPNSIVTGFHTLTKGTNGQPRHPVVREYGDCVQKNSLGGINICFNSNLYQSLIRVALAQNGHWDWNLSRACATKPVPILAPKKSLIEHIGDVSTLPHGNGKEPHDKAYEFVGTGFGVEIVEFRGSKYPKFQTNGNASRFCMPFAKELLKGKILDIGYGKEEWKFEGATGVDLADETPYHAMNLPEGEWDGIFSSHLLEHLERPFEALDLWTSKLVSGGVMFLYLPHPSQLYWRPYHNRKHLSSFDPEIIRDYFVASGKYTDIFVSGCDAYNSFTVFAEKT